jgi:peroxiredoxin
MNTMSKQRFGATSATISETPSRTRTRTHARARSGKNTSWGRLAGAGVLVLLIAGVLVWMATQQSAAGSTNQGLVGAQAPLTSMRFASSQGRALSLDQFRGKKVVLFFYEGSTCGSCQQELSLLQGIVGMRHDTVAVAASVDPVSTSTNVAKQLKLGYPILADVNHLLGSAFNDFHVEVAGMDMGSVDNHAVYVLDAKGVVRWANQAPSTMWIAEPDITAALNKA